MKKTKDFSKLDKVPFDAICPKLDNLPGKPMERFHTPTPWTLNLPDYDTTFRACIQLPDGQTWTDRDGEWTHGNLSFVVRAVNAHEELLKVARHALDIFENLGHGYSVEGMLKEAIAKAEGK